MATTLTNPANGCFIAEQMTDQKLIPANNLADLPARVTAMSNLTTHKAVTYTVTAVAGASNASTVTVTAKDASGATVTGVRYFDLYTTSDAAGTTVSSTSYSGTLVASTGTIMATITAKHVFRCATDATGVFVGTLTDTAKTADFIAVPNPLTNGAVVSSAIAYG